MARNYEQFAYLIALRERILDASGWLHVVSGCLYHSRSREGQLQVVCNALNLGTSGLLLLGRIYYFLVLQTSLHRVFMLKGAGGSKESDRKKKKKVKTVEPDQLQFQKQGLVAATVTMIAHGGGHTVLLPGSSGGDH